MEENKSCYNCKNFNQHYAMTKCSIIHLNCGHCMVKKIKAKERSEFPFKEGCELWEDIKIRNYERKESIVKKLNGMAKEIKEISVMLKELERLSTE